MPRSGRSARGMARQALTDEYTPKEMTRESGLQVPARTVYWTRGYEVMQVLSCGPNKCNITPGIGCGHLSPGSVRNRDIPISLCGGRDLFRIWF
jgi:hypothetical protein